MDKQLLELVSREIPDINMDVVEGLAVKELKYVEQYVDTFIRHAEVDFPTGLKYVEYRVLSPVEEYIKITEPRSSRSQFNIARSDVYMIELIFDYEGQKIHKPLFLPYVRKGGILTLRGATFAISPVLVDKGMSLGSDSVFVQISKTRSTFKRTRHHINVDGVTRSPNVAHSWLHNRDRSSDKNCGRPIVKMETTLVHYLFAKFGVRETFKKFNGTDIAIGSTDTINVETHPQKDWVICTSKNFKPRGMKVHIYKPTNLAIAVRRCDFDMVCESMIGGLFYTVDHFTRRISPEFIDGTEHELRLWRILLGYIIGGVTGGEGSICEAMDEHIESLDSYIDAGAKATLAQGDIYVDDLYELLYHILQILSEMVIQSSESLASMYDKQFLVLRYVLRDIGEGLNRMLFKLMNVSKKKTLTAKDVYNTIMRQPSTEAVLNLNNSGKHGEVSSVSSPSDNMFFKITSNTILQTDSGGNLKASKSTNIDRSKYLHASIAEVGSYTMLPKSEPTGRNRINPWVKLNKDGFIMKDPNKADLIKRTQMAIRRED